MVKLSGSARAVTSSFATWGPVGLPDVLVSDRDRDTRFTSVFWTDLHTALGASLVFGSQHHHNTMSKVDRLNGVIADILRSFASGGADDWPAELMPLVEFAINDSETTQRRRSSLGSGYTHFYAGRGQHQRCRAARCCSPLGDDEGAAPTGTGPELTGEVRALRSRSQDRRKAPEARRAPAGRALRRAGRGAPRHRTHPSDVALVALAALDEPLQSARVPGA